MSSIKILRVFVLLLGLSIWCLSMTGSGCRGKTLAPPVPAETRQVTDDLGRIVRVPVKITRAISLAPSITETIFAVGAADRLVGVTTYCNYPEQAKSIAKVGDTLTPNLETIVALKPDVVFVSTASQIEAFKGTLEQNGIAVYVTNPNSIEGVLSDLMKIGELFGTVDKTSVLLNDLQSRLDEVSRRLNGEPRPGVFLQISKEPLFTIGKQSFMTAIIEKAGGRSVTADIESSYPKLSKETALALNPDAIILSTSDDNRVANDVFKNSRAMKNSKVFSIDADLLSRPGPRLVDGLEAIARDIHPDKFVQ
ncbi:MAG: cobalamin-binding protein [Acidobacteriota bacterium]